MVFEKLFGRGFKELNEKKETIELRLKSLQKQEKRLKEKLKESQEKFEEIMKEQEKPKITAG